MGSFDTHRSAPPLASPRELEETPSGEDLGFPPDAFRVQPEWRKTLPWLLQGTTTAGSADGGSLDLRLFGAEAGGEALERWESLRLGGEMGRAVVGRQVHGARIRVHADASPGVLVVADTDAHASREPGVLLGVTLADCLPLFLVDAAVRAVALAHAGWRGVASGIVEDSVATLVDRFGSDPDDLRAHLGPAVCGECYEVGPEVHRSLGREEPAAPCPVDLRKEVAGRLVAYGVDLERVTASSLCTRCGSVPFHSHRRGDPGRQAALLGIRWSQGP